MSLVRVTTIDNSYEAEFLKEDLEEAGVHCVLTNVNLTNLYPGLGSFYHGAGIGVMVLEQDHARAEEVVQKRNVINRITRCPNCGSTKVEHLPGPDGGWRRIWLTVLMVFGLVPVARLKDKYHCYACNPGSTVKLVLNGHWWQNVSRWLVRH